MLNSLGKNITMKNIDKKIFSLVKKSKSNTQFEFEKDIELLELSETENNDSRFQEFSMTKCTNYLH